MYESFDAHEHLFKIPNIQSERGEFERVAQEFLLDTGTLMFLAEEEEKLVPLSPVIWRELINTRSFGIQRGDWALVHQYSVLENDHARDWETLRSKMEQGEPLDAPIIMKINEEYHLVAGDTRIMVARALGIIPQVLLFEYVHDRTHEQEKE